MTASQPQFQGESGYDGGKKNVIALRAAEFNDQGIPEKSSDYSQFSCMYDCMPSSHIGQEFSKEHERSPGPGKPAEQVSISMPALWGCWETSSSL